MFTITVSKIVEVQKDFSPRIQRKYSNSIQIGMKMNLTMNNTVFKHNELIFGKLTLISPPEPDFGRVILLSI